MKLPTVRDAGGENIGTAIVDACRFIAITIAGDMSKKNSGRLYRHYNENH